MRLALFMGALVLGALVVWFLGSLFVRPQLALPSSFKKIQSHLRGLEKSGGIGPGSHQEIWKRFAMVQNSKRALKESKRLQPVRLGWCENSGERSYQSLNEHAKELTHVCTEWMTVTDAEGSIVSRHDPQLLEHAERAGLNFLPILDNVAGKSRQPEPVENLANGPKSKRDRLFASVIEELRNSNASGVIVDWEELDPTYKENYTTLLREMSAALHAAGKELWLAVPMGEDVACFDFEKLSPCVDRFVALLFDENSEDDAPGPLASLEWIKGWVRVLSDYGDPEQWVGVLGAYGIDWDTKLKRAEIIGFADAMSRARCAGVQQVEVAAPYFNGQYSYEQESGEHKVVFLDAVSFLNELAVLEKADFGGIGITRLGGEDRSIWNVLASGAERSLSNVSKLQELESSDTIANVGAGEIVTVSDESGPGKRRLQVDDQKQVSAVYTQLPVFPSVFHQGAEDPKEVVLTFDDGPDPYWTPRILDVLKQKQAKAVFFVVGNKVETSPELVRRILAEGHEIGSHTYTHANLGVISRKQIELELNATQMLLESVVGCSTTLFRPPYNADSRPTTMNELRPLKIIQDEMGYLMVLENIDPQDWERPGAATILQRIKEQRSQGSIILLHDAGGNRSDTVEALPAIIDYLRERGDNIVSLSQMLDVPKTELMPVLNQEHVPLSVKVTGMGFHFWRHFKQLFAGFLVFATLIVVVRALLIAWLALKEHRTKPCAGAGRALPPVSVLIAAYNESKVIKATLQALLQTDYPAPFEIVVVDDGSNDDTATQVQEVARGDDRIRLIRQKNAGKSVALSTALANSTHEFLVFLDSDTHFEPTTLRELVAPFADETVGGVAGHGKVGNQRTLIAKCQSLEYACGFNMDRRAYSAWNCITVLPGAICAIRRSALQKAGGFSTDTLAEDTDLTLALHKCGYRIAYAPHAIAWTEAPETYRTLAKQRFRWAFGTLQCLWKHRDMLFNSEFRALGWFSLPSVWFFQIGLVALTPMVDAMLLFSLVSGNGLAVWTYVLVFLLMDVALAALACWMEKAPLKKAWLMVVMRIIYRPLLSYVVWRSILKALKGVWVHWGKLERTASVQLAPSGK